jgi:hypothetical protein
LSYEQILEVSNCNGCRNEIGWWKSQFIAH